MQQDMSIFAQGYFDRFSMIDWGRECVKLNNAQVHVILMAPEISRIPFCFYLTSSPRFKRGETPKMCCCKDNVAQTTVFPISISVQSPKDINSEESKQ